MKKIDNVLKQLSNLYEFNRNIKTYKIQSPTKIKGQPANEPDSKKHHFVETLVSQSKYT